MKDKLRIAVIGAKRMGSKHIAILNQFHSDDVEIIGILNSTIKSTNEKAKELGVHAFANIEELIENKPDAVIISTPATTHHEIGLKVLGAKIPCLMEKPLATTVAECKDLINLAKENDTLLFVGHTENYNPAVIMLKTIIDAPIKKLKALRISSNVAKNDVSVVQELMIHDLAIVNSLFTSPIRNSKLAKAPDYEWYEHADARISFEDGSVARVEGLIAPVEAKREMEVEDIKGNIYEIDFLERSLKKNGVLISKGGNSLENELGNFVRCLQGKEEPFVSPEEALKSVETCIILEKNIPKN